MIGQVLVEGLLLGILLIGICAFEIRNGAVMNVMDRLLVDGWWVGHTKAWTIPGTEDLKPYINGEDKKNKWMAGTVGMAVISAVLAGIGALVL